MRSTTDSMFTSRVSTGVESSSSISSLSTNISDSTVTAVFSTTIGAVSQTGSFFSCSFVSSSCSIIRSMSNGADLLSITIGESSARRLPFSCNDSWVRLEGSTSITFSTVTSKSSTVAESPFLASSLSTKSSDTRIARVSFSTTTTSVSTTGSMSCLSSLTSKSIACSTLTEIGFFFTTIG